MASLKEYLQQALKVQQEMTRSGAPTGKELNPLELSATPNSSPMAESSTVQVMMRPEYKYQKLEMPIFSGFLLRAERFFDLHKYSEADRLEVTVERFKGDAL